MRIYETKRIYKDIQPTRIFGKIGVSILLGICMHFCKMGHLIVSVYDRGLV